MVILPIKPIREKYSNHPKSRNIEKLELLAKAEKTIQRNIGVSNVYTFLHAYFEGVEYYAEKRYVHFTN